MILSYSLETEEFGNKVAEFIRYNRTSVPKGLKTQARLLALRLIQFTPPQGGRTQGKAAVARDIRRAVQPLRAQDFSNKRIKELIRNKDNAGLEVVFSKFKSGDLRNAKVVPFKPSLHQSQRDRRGRVRNNKRVASTDATEIKDYIAKKQRNVGEARGGWAAAALLFGGGVADWIRAHAGAGEVEDFTQAIEPYIRMENNSTWAGGGDEDRIVANAIKSRSAAITADLARAQKEALDKAQL